MSPRGGLQCISSKTPAEPPRAERHEYYCTIPSSIIEKISLVTKRSSGSSNNRLRLLSSGGDERREEVELIGKARSGDAAAFGKLVELHEERVFNLAARMVGDRQTAEDLAQDVFVKAFRRIGGFRGESRFSTWLYALTLNRCRDYLKSAARRETPTGEEAFFGWSDEKDGPEEAASVSESARRIERALLKLDVKYREAFLLRFVEKLDYREISGAIGKSESAAKMRVARALTKLRELVDERDEE